MLDLFTIAPLEVQALMQNENDPAVLRILARLESAAQTGDDISRIEAIGDLTELLVLQQGNWA